MSIFLIKSFLSFLLLLLAGAAMVTMYEIFGANGKEINVERYKKIHKACGFLYVLLFLGISYICIDYVVATRTELNARSALHTALALSIAAVFILKMAILKRYRQFYNQAKIIGLLIVIFTFVLTGITGGYYLLVTGFGSDNEFYGAQRGYSQRPYESPLWKQHEAGKTAGPAGDAERGKMLFAAKCVFCHDPASTKIIVGPGMKGILANPTLPVSKRAATPENIMYQMQHPFDKMPAFPALSDAETADLIAYLKTL